MRRLAVRFSLAVALVVLAAPFHPVLGQAETGRITGRVLDSQGAAVPGATVTATNAATGVVRSTVSDGEGIYVLPNLPPATYEVKVELTGFRAVQATRTLTVGGTVNFDATLQVGALSEVVQVVGGIEPLVNTRTPEISTNINSDQLRELPTLTRNPYDLVALAPTATDEDPSGRGAGFALNGLRAAATNALLDGAANNDEFTGAVGMSVPLDAVQEFSVISNNFSPQYGRATAGIVNVVVKSGTNRFRGSGYEYFRNEKLSTNTFENEERGNPKGEFNRNQYGGSFGGPIKRDSIFFFANYEGIRVRSLETTTHWVPTPQFLALTNANTRNFFSGYTIDAEETGVIATRAEVGYTGSGAFAALPASLPVLTQVRRSVPLDAGGGDPQDTSMLVGRVDWSISPNANFYTRYSWEDSEFLKGSNADSPWAGFDTGSLIKNHNILASLTNVFSSRFTTQSKFVFSRLDRNDPLEDQPPGPTLYMRSARTSVQGVNIALPGYLPFNPGSAIPFGGPQNFIQFYEDATWLRGNHDLRFGGTYIQMRDNRTFGAYQNSVQTLGGTNTNLAWDNLVLGQLQGFSAAVDPQGKFPGDVLTLPVGFPSFTRNNRYSEWALYFNDAWTIAPRLTLNLGLRYEYFGVQHNKDPRLDSNFYYGPGATVAEQVRNGRVMIAEDSPAGGLWRPDRNNFAPRIGFAYDLTGDGRASIRGGYGIAYERNFGNVTFNVIQNPPNYAVVTLVAPQDVPSLPITTENTGPLSGTGQKVLPPTGLRHVNENIHNAYAHLWSVSYQRLLGGRVSASVDYSGSKGVDLYSIEDPNTPGGAAVYLGDLSGPGCPGECARRVNTQYTGMNTRGNLGKSLYNGLIFGLDARAVANTGLNLTSRYTLGYAKDNLSSSFSESNNNFNLGLLDPFDPDLDYGWADFDVRHRFSFGGVWEIPFMRGRGGMAETLAGGWQVASTFTAQTGAPFTVFDCSTANTRCIRMLEVAALPDPLSEPRSTGDPNTYVYMDLSNQEAGIGTYENPLTGNNDFGPFPDNMTERNIFRRPGRWNIDAVFSKRFRAGDRLGGQFRLEVYNVFKHANLYVRDSETDLSAGTDILAFRGDTGVGDGAPEGDGQRRIQLGFRFDW